MTNEPTARDFLLHEFVPIEPVDAKCQAEGCGPRCWCAKCGHNKGDRTRHTDWRRTNRTVDVRRHEPSLQGNK